MLVFIAKISVYLTLEYKTFDYRATLAKPLLTHHPDIILILIDEASMKEMDATLGAGLGLVIFTMIFYFSCLFLKHVL